MKRSVDKSKKLPAFALDLPALRLLIADLTEVFSGGTPNLTLRISLKGEELKFEGLDELEDYAAKLPSTLRSLTWLMLDYESGRVCRLRGGGRWFLEPVEVVTSASNEAWCAGAIAIVEAHARRNKRWYFFLKGWTLWLLAFTLGLVPMLGGLLHLNILRNAITDVSWFALSILLWIMYFTYGSLFPQHVIMVRTEETWLRRY